MANRTMKHSAPRGLFGKARALAGQHAMSLRVGIGGFLMLALVAFLMLHTAGTPPEHQAPPITMIMIQPQKPPPPPPPPQQQKMIVQPKMTVPVQKPLVPNQPPSKAPPKPAGPAAPALGTSIKSNGSTNAFDLSGNAGGGLIGGGGGGGGDAQDYYSGQVQSKISQALAQNPKTRKSTFAMDVRIWIDAGGAVNHATVSISTGNPALDAAIVNDVLVGLPLGLPPAGIPMPVVVHITAQAAFQ